jgi:hypothetical protein
MDKQAALSKILKVSLMHANHGIGIGGTPSTMSHPQSFQPQLNQAIHTYTTTGELDQLAGIVHVMVTTNALSGKEADEILAALEGS